MNEAERLQQDTLRGLQRAQIERLTDALRKIRDMHEPLSEALALVALGERIEPVPPRKPRTYDYTIGGCTLPLPCGGYVTHHLGLVPHTEVHRCRGSKCGEPMGEGETGHG